MSQSRQGAAKQSAPRRGSGAPTEEYYRSIGLEQVKLRLHRDALRDLDALVAKRGTSRTEVVTELLRRGL